MATKNYYAGHNAYGVRTVNCWRIKSFATKAERDEYVKSDEQHNEAVTVKEAKRRLSNGYASASDVVMRQLGYSNDIYTGFDEE